MHPVLKTYFLILRISLFFFFLNINVSIMLAMCYCALLVTLNGELLTFMLSLS